MYYYKTSGGIIAVNHTIDAEEITKEEYMTLKASIKIPVWTEAEYWASIPYDEAVNEKIRERYSVSQEFAILRQKDEKPDEYAEYFAYCEECKAFVKSKKEMT